MFKDHPKGLIPAALSNMGERFGYYIMNAVLVLFLCSKFGLSDEASAIIYSVFYCGIYVLSLVGGIIADRTQNYKAVIRSGLIIMATGYIILSIPILSTQGNIGWLLPLTCFALLLIFRARGHARGQCFALYVMLYSLVRFALEYLRGDYTEKYLGLFTSAQMTSLGFGLVALAFFLWLGLREHGTVPVETEHVSERKKRRKNNRQKDL